MNDKLTESQRNLLAAVRQVLAEDITAPILAEVEALRKEQKERHEQGVREKQERDDKLKRHVIGILAALGIHLNDKNK